MASSSRASARHGQMRLLRGSGRRARSWRNAMRPSRKSTNGTRVPSGPPMEGCAMRRFKTTACGLMLMLGANGCTSVPSAPAPAVECPTPAPPPAWIMEPAPNLIPLLDRIISPSGPGSSN
ncbi:Rz1 family lipoprotein [Achromobacter sp. SIMBA_011]|uniref:Rz1 family lipoprotein n=1 Tax=Achromobacter sp. SIMBA_011 TaxID=3085759 RepID=UPI00397CC54D